MTDLAYYHAPEFVDYCQQSLQKYAQSYRGIDMLILTTPAGFEIASYANSGLYHRSKLAAIGSSLYKVGDSLATESRLKPCESVLLDTENGKIYISSTPSAKRPVILVVKANQHATLGNMIYGAKKLGEDVTSRLQDD